MPYFAHFKPYDYPIMQFPGFYNALFDIFPNKNHAKLRWKNAVRKIFHRASAQLKPLGTREAQLKQSLRLYLERALAHLAPPLWLLIPMMQLRPKEIRHKQPYPFSHRLYLIHSVYSHFHESPYKDFHTPQRHPAHPLPPHYPLQRLCCFQCVCLE